jgi:hypothetical protein
VDGEDIRSSGLVNGRLVMDYAPRCRCGVQADRYPDDGLTWCVWKLSNCKNGSECWKIATRGPAGRIL